MRFRSKRRTHSSHRIRLPQNKSLEVYAAFIYNRVHRTAPRKSTHMLVIEMAMIFECFKLIRCGFLTLNSLAEKAYGGSVLMEPDATAPADCFSMRERHSSG
eukprot:IDg1565t1